MKAVNFVEDVRDKLVPIDQVRQHPDNSNNGDVDALIESIQLNGFYSTVTVDRNTGYILAGNHRYQALHALGATHIPVVWLDRDRGGSIRILVGDNKTGKLAVVDSAQQIELLRELAETQQGLAGTGYTQDAFLQLVQDFANQGNEIPTADGFGHGVAPSGIYQVVVDFEDQDERDLAFADLADRHPGKVRTVNL